MITTEENNIMMSKKRFYNIMWAIEYLNIPETKRPSHIMVRAIMEELYIDYKMLQKVDVRVARVERADKKRQAAIAAEVM